MIYGHPPIDARKPPTHDVLVFINSTNITSLARWLPTRCIAQRGTQEQLRTLNRDNYTITMNSNLLKDKAKVYKAFAAYTAYKFPFIAAAARHFYAKYDRIKNRVNRLPAQPRLLAYKLLHRQNMVPYQWPQWLVVDAIGAQLRAFGNSTD